MLREYIVSEALHRLGIPTTRSLAVALTGKRVDRGEGALPGAVLTRVAASHIRVGTFDYAAAFGTREDLRALADYAVQRHYPALEGRSDKYISFLRGVAERQASLIVKWQLVGFVHGVMNTDNAAVSGETIDFGPCAFMDAYDPATVFSAIDTHGRYAYGNQPAIGAWNLARLAASLLPLLHEDKSEAAALAAGAIDFYWERFNADWAAGMRAKLGIAGGDGPGGDETINELLDIMEKNKLDYTHTFRALSFPIDDASPLLGIPALAPWLDKWRARVRTNEKETYRAMQRVNPAVIPRNHRVEEALSAAGEGDCGVMRDLLAALHCPFEDNEAYAQPPPPGCGCGYKTFCGT
jgi:uncharacterized protein YdiU (UPF0061 family)